MRGVLGLREVAPKGQLGAWELRHWAAFISLMFYSGGIDFCSQVSPPKTSRIYRCAYLKDRNGCLVTYSVFSISVRSDPDSHTFFKKKKIGLGSNSKRLSL